jgi:hypothetical protein
MVGTAEKRFRRTHFAALDYCGVEVLGPENQGAIQVPPPLVHDCISLAALPA